MNSILKEVTEMKILQMQSQCFYHKGFCEKEGLCNKQPWCRGGRYGGLEDLSAPCLNGQHTPDQQSGVDIVQIMQCSLLCIF
jgi:hypothetical protein